MSLAYRKCPKCGADVSAESRFCGNCGNDMVVAKVSGWIIAARIVSVIALVLIACPAGAWGGCMLILSIGSGFSALEFLYAISLVGVAVALMWFMIWAFQRR